MTPDEFRREFNRVPKHELMYCERALAGEPWIVVGLDGPFAVMHRDVRVALASLEVHPVNDGWLREKPGVVDLAETAAKAASR